MSDLFLEFRTSPQVPADSAGAHVDLTKFNSLPDRHGDLDQADELALMKRLSESDEAAMNLLIEHHGNSLARLVGRLTAWSADHEDVFQEVLLHVWQKANTFRGQGPLGGWLRRLTINQCHNHLRKQNTIKRKLIRLFERKLATGTMPQPPHEPSQPMQAALAKLAANERTAVVLFYLEEMTTEEVASHLGIKTETLHVRLHRARNKLKGILECKVDK